MFLKHIDVTTGKNEYLHFFMHGEGREKDSALGISVSGISHGGLSCLLFCRLQLMFSSKKCSFWPSL